MKYRIISVGKIRESFYAEGINEYLKRLRPYCSLELIDGLEEKVSPKAGRQEIEKVLEKEAGRIRSLLGNDGLLVVLDSRGKQLTSEDLARHIDYWNSSGRSRVNLVIGGPHGLADDLKRQADLSISFSPMTFLHQMAVLILAEQLYRGFKILKNEPYHK